MPMFLHACEKSVENIQLSEDLDREIHSFRECQDAIRLAPYDLTVREEKTAESQAHLGEDCLL